MLATPATLPAPRGGGIHLEYRDTTCSACQAFYEYANGNWIRAARRGTDDEAAGTIQDLAVRRRAAMRSILDSLLLHSRETRAPAGPLRASYGSCLDVRHIEAAGTTPLQNEIRRIERIGSVIELSREAARLQRIRYGQSSWWRHCRLRATRSMSSPIYSRLARDSAIARAISIATATTTLRRRYRRRLELGQSIVLPPSERVPLW